MSDKPETKTAVSCLIQYEIESLLKTTSMDEWLEVVESIKHTRGGSMPPDWDEVVTDGEMWKKLPWCNLKLGASTTKAQEAEAKGRDIDVEPESFLRPTPTNLKVRPEATPHYAKHPSGIECITIAEGFNFNLGNVIKYIWRAGLKGGAIEDLKKARDYINFEIDRVNRMP